MFTSSGGWLRTLSPPGRSALADRDPNPTQTAMSTTNLDTFLRALIIHHGGPLLFADLIIEVSCEFDLNSEDSATAIREWLDRTEDAVRIQEAGDADWSWRGKVTLTPREAITHRVPTEVQLLRSELLHYLAQASSLARLTAADAGDVADVVSCALQAGGLQCGTLTDSEYRDLSDANQAVLRSPRSIVNRVRLARELDACWLAVRERLLSTPSPLGVIS